MSFVEWENKLNLGIKKIDEHHRQLVKILNDTYNAIILDCKQPELEAIIEKLADYTTYHFTTEERLMTEHNFGGMHNHLLEHEKFSRNILDFQDMCSRGESVIAIDLLVFLRGWLVNHILKVDREYVTFLINKGVT
jgi:hemerythrin